jgi:hypothetical protein
MQRGETDVFPTGVKNISKAVIWCKENWTLYTVLNEISILYLI